MLRMRNQLSKEQAERMFNRKASPDSYMEPKAFLRREIGKVKNKVIDKVSDMMSYPARRKAQKAMIKADNDVSDIKMVREMKSVDTSDRDWQDPLFRARANVSGLKFRAEREALKSLTTK